MILSTLPSTFLPAKPSSSSPSPRVSSSSLLFSNLCFLAFSSSPSSSAYHSLCPSLGSNRSSVRRFSSPCLLSAFNVHAMAELVKDEEAVVASASSEQEKPSHSATFLDARTEEELLSGIREEVEAGRLPSNVATGMEELYQNYKYAVLQSGIPDANEIVLSNMAVALDRIFLDVEDPFVFPPYHKAVREPFDYYNFGQNYIRPLIDFRNSYVGNISLFNEIEEKLRQGHNVVLISNHQTEADPAVIALLLEATSPHVAENLIYVAGDRVVTDPLCKPFSMGRNLICVYSKKHMYDVPELAEVKKKANIRSLKEMALLLRGGSQIVWIAPSGGRDRLDTLTGEWHPAPFDASSVDNMRRLAQHSGAPGHIYPLALLCYDIMPPPPQVEKEIGEKRVISHHGVGLSIAPEIRFSESTSVSENTEEFDYFPSVTEEKQFIEETIDPGCKILPSIELQAKEAYSQLLYNCVIEQYSVLKSAINNKQGMDAATPTVSLSQPWN